MPLSLFEAGQATPPLLSPRSRVPVSVTIGRTSRTGESGKRRPRSAALPAQECWDGRRPLRSAELCPYSRRKESRLTVTSGPSVRSHGCSDGACAVPFLPSPPALPPKKRQSAPSPTRVAVVAPMSRATSGSSLPIGINKQVGGALRAGIGRTGHSLLASPTNGTACAD